MPANAPTFWQQRGWRAILLLPLAGLFFLIAQLRRWVYRLDRRRVRRAPVPVIVVGNIAVGGSGKTPVVAWLATRLLRQGFQPGIVSRGYGRADDAIRVLTPDDTPATVGDEPVLLAHLTACPVAVGRRRPDVIDALLAAHPAVDVIISDDGLQHLAMARDLEIVVLDERVLGNRWLLPAGPLREPLGRLRAADLVLCHGVPGPWLSRHLDPARTAPMSLVGHHFERLADRGECRSPVDFAGRRVHAVAGIGRPRRFFDQLRAMGLDVVEHPFPDHHRFVADDLAFAAHEPLLMTEKDAVKCASFAPADTWVFPVHADISEAALRPILETLERHGRQAA
ncbi:tetraacyldisaccharide 4'-kinase [Nitrogeniibacter mangrovi]|uniref:Tetraacyldisaccharide 4'-kinase n=1 Tax=Nitrogeniibacter mangrovi TaxID=2016596 RepID=A0A6C1B618_9RHOO|nr:tetraacyldisaccharide 4'-kinase [Nitrogeniibacter mangrovi]QID18245.1 tetraacyldisaccharide 4'-kinase [Nitrogeniibacter mangrovi]